VGVLHQGFFERKVLDMANAILFAILFVLTIGGMLLVITWALNSVR
jgi:hypothetical protein